MKAKYQEEAVHLIDRLVDVLSTQFSEFENAYTKTVFLTEHYQNKFIDSEENIKQPFQRALNKKKGQQAELLKLV